MNQIVFMFAAFLLTFATQWWLLRDRYATKLRSAIDQHLREREETTRLLAAARRQATDLKLQLESARLEIKRTERSLPHRPTPTHDDASESLLFRLDTESSAVRMADAFAETTIKLNGGLQACARALRAR